MDTTQDFSPYRADGKLVSGSPYCIMNQTKANALSQYGFVCVVTGALQPVGQAIIEELAAHGAASIYGTTRETLMEPLQAFDLTI